MPPVKLESPRLRKGMPIVVRDVAEGRCQFERDAEEARMLLGEAYGDRIAVACSCVLHDSVISSNKRIQASTWLEQDEFFMVYAQLRRRLEKEKPRLFRYKGFSYGDPGNRCLLHVRHALLLALKYARTCVSQADLANQFMID